MSRVGIIGWPVSHSRSPLIHNHWLAAHGIDAHYELCPIDPADDFAAALGAMAAAGFIGANVTIPHKENAFAAMHRLDAAAQSLGAVNTIGFQDGVFIGSNTDGAGFIAGLDEAAPAHNWRAHPVLVLGAGGAARAIIVALQQAGVPHIRITNRTYARAEALSDLGDNVQIIDWAKRAEAADQCHLMVNTTSLGMRGAVALDMPLEGLAAGALVSDIVYTPLETDLLRRAAASGFVAVDGLGMLLHQAALSFEIWFGVRPQVTPALRRLCQADLAQKGD